MLLPLFCPFACKNHFKLYYVTRHIDNKKGRPFRKRPTTTIAPPRLPFSPPPRQRPQPLAPSAVRLDGCHTPLCGQRPQAPSGIQESTATTAPPRRLVVTANGVTYYSYRDPSLCGDPAEGLQVSRGWPLACT